MSILKQVLGEGSTNPQLIIIGEAPGEQEEYHGQPFFPEAPSGRLLMGLLASVGLKREDVYLDNILPIRPPNNKLNRLSELGVTVEQFLPSLEERLNKIDCPVVIPMGDLALYHLTGMGSITKKGEISGITKHRGSVYSSIISKGRHCIPTFHPRYLIEMYKMRGILIEDLKKGLRIRKEGYNEPIFSTIINPTMSDVEGFLDECSKVSRFSFDIEVVGGGQIACVGIGISINNNNQRTSLCIPFKFGFNNYWNEIEEHHIWGLLRKLFQGDQLKIGQNLNYDLTKLLPFIGEPSPPWFDLMMAHHLIEPELPHTLAFQTSLYTWPPVNYYKDDPKDEEKSWKGITSSETLWLYNGKDCEIPLQLEEVFRDELREMKMLDFFEGFMMSKMRVLWRIQQRGLLLDESKRQELLEGQTQILKGEIKKFEELVGHPINPLSNKQVMEYLYQELKLPTQYQRKTRQPTVDAEALDKLYVYHPHPSLKQVIEIRELSHDINTYLMVEAESDGRVKGRYNAAGAATGRSSSKKNYEGRGLDLHNIPEEDRQMFRAKEGSSILVRDLWQAETFLVALLSQCQSFLLRLKEGKKVHKLVASWIFGKPEEEIDNNNKPGGEYYTGKRSGHGLNYGLGPILLAINLKCSVSEAKKIRDIYFKYAHEITAWHKEIENEIKQTRKLTTPFGRTRIFRDRIGDDLFRKAYAHVPQSTIAEYNHLAMIKLEYTLPDGAEIIQEGYDALVLEVEDGLIEEVNKIIEKAYDKKVYCKGDLVKIPTEGSVSKRWMK